MSVDMDTLPLMDELVERDNSVGVHCCVLYHNEQEHSQITTKYVMEGLLQNQKVAYFYEKHSIEELQVRSLIKERISSF